MEDFYNYNNIDIKQVQWGKPPAPLLPTSLRVAWADEGLPDWVCVDAGLPRGATVADLGPDVWATMEIIPPRLTYFLRFLMRKRANAVGRLRCVERVWPLGLKVSDVGWSPRTRNCLAKRNLFEDEQRLMTLTFDELFRIEGMGATTVLDYCSTLEGAMDYFEQLVKQYAPNNIGDKPTDLLSILEQVTDEEWLAQISRQDPRFRSLLPPGSGTLQDRIEKLLGEPSAIGSIADVPLLIEAIKKLQQHVDELNEQLLEDSLRSFLKLLSRMDGERLDALAARLGWNGNKAVTLEQCGQRLGITRERMRQIQSKVLKRLPDHEVFMPRLDEALSLLEDRAPLRLAQASRVLRDSGITRTQFHPESLLNVAELLGKKTTLRLCETRTGKMIASEPNLKVVQLIPALARKLAGQSGVTSVFQVLDTLEAMGHQVDDDDLRRMLNDNPTFDFLNDDWFWAVDIKDKRNRLRNIARKILSVATPQDVRTIRDGVRRAYRVRAASHDRYATLVVPPLDVMTTFFQRHPDFRVEGNAVYSSVSLDHKKELGDTDRIMVEVLRSSPAGVMDRTSFAQACLVRGMNENTFSVYSSYSCVIEHVGIGVWKLRGVIVDPAAIEAVRIANHLKPREQRVLEYGWTDDGKLWIAARIPRLGKNSMVIGCPGAVRRYLIGQKFECKANEGNSPCGTIAINDQGSSYGYGPFVRRYGLDENDILLAAFDLATNIVTLSLADEEILEEAIEGG